MKRKTTLFFILAFITYITSGCSTQPKPLYTYGDYSEAYYASKKELTPESALRLQKSIEYAIENSGESSSGRVAPGLYANLGYIYLKTGNSSKAIENFKKEKAIYPEAAHFMDRMIKKVEVAQGKTDEK